jgi:hypothetical protein
MITKPLSLALFKLGRIVATPNALDRISSADILYAIQWHQAGDWGDVNEHDRVANNQALCEGTRVVSIYHTKKGIAFWLITEADRSATTVLLPEDY